MVLERVLPAAWLEKRSRYAFALAVIYSLVGIALARLLFPQDPALMAVAFSAILMLPELSKILVLEEEEQHEEKPFAPGAFSEQTYAGGITYSVQARREKHASLLHFLPDLWRDVHDITEVFLFLFLGVFATYALATIALPDFALNDLFQGQIAARELIGAAAFSFSGDLFSQILVNNARVLAAAFLVALVSGAGAILIIIWNASVWGVLFGLTARNAALATGGAPFDYLLLVLLIVTPHMLLEALSYIFAAISGGILSAAALRQRGLRSMRMVLTHEGALLALAALALLAGALVETLVLQNITEYARVIAQSTGLA